MLSDSVRCPTCRATQEWADTCRRCRSDLHLLRTFAEEYENRRESCLLELRAGCIGAALGHARACLELRPDAESRQLLAVCALRAGDWAAALAASG